MKFEVMQGRGQEEKKRAAFLLLNSQVIKKSNTEVHVIPCHEKSRERE
jgi:hypothetical protein